MSFGFSAGDFVAIGKLIGDITGCLQSAGGAKSEYQELIREFESLDAALRHLDRLDDSTSASTSLSAIKCAALSCRLPLEQVLVKARKYDKSLNIWNKSHTVKNTTDKLKWTFGLKDEIKRLQTYLNVHISTINMLLADYSLERMDVTSRIVEADSAQVRNQLHDTHIILEDVRASLPAQALLLRNVHSMVSGIHKLVFGEMKTSLEHFCRMVSKVCVSTQQIYTVILEIRASITIADTRWTHFQAPFVVEDALGFKFPIPSEYDYDMVDTIIRRRFKEGIGSHDVLAGYYELCKTNKISETITATSRLFPGTAITMAIIVCTAYTSDTACPMPQCGSRTTSCNPGGGYTCTICSVRFDRVNKKRRLMDESTNSVEELMEPAATEMASNIEDAGSSRGKKRKISQTKVGDQSALRNVKWTAAIFSPTRLIYVGHSDPEVLRLYIPEENEGVKYTALSHCWGNNPPSEGDPRHFTIDGNIAARLKGFRLSELPETYQDAVRVTRELGIEYLWIDSLCIIQWELDDWKRELGRMGDIFASACLTIAAPSAVDPNAGFLAQNTSTEYMHVQDAADNQMSICTHMDEAGLNKRGWVIQERFLAKQTICLQCGANSNATAL